MKKRPERSVRELYDRTETIDEPEMTPVLEGSCGMEGPTELEKELQRMKPDDDTVPQRNMHCGDMMTETGTCNVCAAPCSSCMHRIAMESNIECESSDICHRKEADICLFIGSKSRAPPDLRHAPSEASNLLTSSSSHDSLSDNAESKASMQAAITFDTTETVGTSLMIEKLGHAPVCHTSTAVTGKGSCNNSFPFVLQTSLHKHESDCHVESDSCISGARDTSVQKSDQIAYMEKKDILCNLALKYNTTVNGSVKANEICNSVETSQNKANKLRKCVLADPLDSSTSNPKSEASVECKMVGDPPSRLFKEEDPCSNKVAGRGGCNKAFMNVNNDEQSETHIPVIDESPFLDSHTEVHVAAESQACESEVLFDVNVCDICGDAGKEDRLATCSRCLDGAEHIYCMRNMLDKLPEGDWLCEECQTKEESEKKRLSKLVSVSRLSKAHQLGEKIQNYGISLNLPKSDMKSTDLDICRPFESMKSPKGLDNKHKSNTDVISSTCKIVSQTRHVSTSPRKSVSCFPETSYKNSRVVKGKPSEIVSSSRRLPAYNGKTSSRSVAPYSSLPRSERELHGPRKILQKQLSSSSLGLMANPKQLLKTRSEVISRELTSRDIRKEGTVETLRKSSSFKSGSSGHISHGLVGESQILKSQRTDESKGFKTTKEGNTAKNKKSFVIERPVGKLLTNSSKPIQELVVKVASNAGNSNNKSEGNKEMHTAPKSKSYMMTDTDNKKPDDVVKGVVCANTSVASNTLKNVGVFLRPQTADTPSYTFQDTKCVGSVSSGLGQVISGNDVPPHSHRLKHLNSTTDSCHDDKIDAICVKPSAKVNLKKRNRWKDAVEAAIDEKIQKRTKSFDPSREQNESNKSLISEVSPKSSLSSKIDGKSLFSEAKSDGDESLRNIDVTSGKREGSEGKQLDFDLNIALPVPDDLKAEPSFQFIPECASLLSSFLGASSFPQHDFIWRGDFEISRTGGRPEVVNGIQAHLSFSASPKVPQVAGRIPYKIQLVEVPRVSSWPLQFQETGPTEENIALYFFAKDFESYEKSYQRLLNDMFKSDLALIGTINEVELLIFHSSTLPETSQRWNTLFFLWGVFRGRKSGYANAHANLQEQTNDLELTVDRFVRESVSSFQKINSANLPKEKMARSGKSVKASIVNPATCGFHSLSPAEARDNICKMEEPTDILKIEKSPVEKAFWDALGTGSCQQSDIASHSYHVNYLPGSVGSFQSPMKASLNSLESNIERPCAAMTGIGSFLGHSDNVEAKRNFHVQTHDDENANKPFSGLFVASESMKGDKPSVSLEETMRKISVKNETEQVTPAMIATNSVNWRLNKGCLNLLSTPLWGETSMDSRKSEIFQDSTHFVFGEDNHTSKRMKYCSDIHDTNSFRDIGEDIKSTSSKMCLFSDLCSEQHQREDSNCGERMLRKSKLAENQSSDPISFTHVSSVDDGCPNYSTIDLNLALGPSKRLLKGAFASVSQFNNDRTGKLPNFSVGGKLDISDSLSHVLPMAKVGKLMQKSIKTENIYPEKPEGHSTSLPMLRGRHSSTPFDMQ